ncbi:NADH-quinone oxidoreductase subunit J [Haloglycomyces albus]|uniref:NADH-quinone oxidoreductase subunit J n=1 Tax=Haloglycomyces albus TaxID=526067 RepID=UPI0004A438CE|nr:NADH-quinone oxidoreductase subunit J [Haloglycomyces albus]
MYDTASLMAASGGEAVAFWILAPIALGGAIGLVLARSAIHAALMLVSTMLCMGVFYIMQSAPFLGFTQIMVYTGAIMMLFLFVLMLFGRGSRDSVMETLRGQRLAAVSLGIGLSFLLSGGIAHAVSGLVVSPTGPPEVVTSAGNPSNIAAIAHSLFGTYVFAFEIIAGLLTVAAMGALMFAHVTKYGPAKTQKENSRERFAEGNYPGPQSGPGVFATSSSTATPALLPDGSVAGSSISEHVPQRQLSDTEAAPKNTQGSSK